MLLMAEMGLFVVLIVPFPFTVKRKIFTYVRLQRDPAVTSLDL